MKILILGAGGVGGYFGARLMEAGADVTYLVREKRRQSLAENGLKIESPHGNLSLPVKAVTAETVGPGFDVIILAPKAYDLEASLASLEKAIDGKAVLLPFLNGTTHMQKLDERFGRANVMGGVAEIAATLTDDGVVRQLSDKHLLVIGHRDPAHEVLARALFALCQRAKFDSIYADNIEQSLWTKWTYLATLAAATTLYRGAVGQIMATRAGERLVRAMYAECLALAQAHGFPIPADAQSTALNNLTKPGSSATASMFRDLLAGRRTEHEHIFGEAVAMAERQKLAFPLMTAAYCHMQVEAGV